MKTISVALISIVLFFGMSGATNAALWLDADPSFYVNEDPDAWFKDSWITGPGNLTLQITNTFNNNAINNIYLVIALLEDTKNGLSITLGSDPTPLTGSDFDTDGNHPVITDSHGVFGDGTYFYDYRIGNLASNETYDLDISITTAGIPIVHFDAYGDKVKRNGDLLSIDNPNSHDVTWDTPIPEPATMSLLGMGLIGLTGRKRKFKV